MLLRELVGEALRSSRLRQGKTLREVSSAARVSLGYLSEVERGQKEASSELLAAMCDALDVELVDLLTEISCAVALRRTPPPRIITPPTIAAPVQVGAPTGPVAVAA